MKEHQSPRASRGAFPGLFIIIGIVVAVSAVSFTLGFFVGKRSGQYDEKQLVELRTAPALPQNEAERPVPPPGSDRAGTVQETGQTSPVKTSQEIPGTDAGQTEQAPPPSVSDSPESVKKAGTRYSVQVGAFRTIKEASALKSNLQKKGYNSYVETVQMKTKKLYKVKVGAFSTREEADKISSELKKIKGMKPFIVVSK